MKLTTNIQGDFAIIKFEANKIIGYEAQEFQESLLNCLEKGSKIIVVNLTGVTFISSWGIGMLIHGLTTTKNRGGEFRVACLSDSVLQVFKTVKIDTVLNIYSTMEDALTVK